MEMRSTTGIRASLVCIALLLMLPFQLTAAQRITRANFVSCPGCRLNHLPEVKRFLRMDVEPGHWKGVTVDFISGRHPELFLYDETGSEVERMYIDKLNFDELTTLLQQKGFTRS